MQSNAKDAQSQPCQYLGGVLLSKAMTHHHMPDLEETEHYKPASWLKDKAVESGDPPYFTDDDGMAGTPLAATIQLPSRTIKVQRVHRLGRKAWSDTGGAALILEDLDVIVAPEGWEVQSKQLSVLSLSPHM